MFEHTTDPKMRYMLQNAHKERAQAVRAAWNWITRRK